MDTIHALAGEIGPRASCSREERRAAEWCAARLSDESYEVTADKATDVARTVIEAVVTAQVCP